MCLSCCINILGSVNIHDLDRLSDSEASLSVQATAVASCKGLDYTDDDDRIYQLQGLSACLKKIVKSPKCVLLTF